MTFPYRLLGDILRQMLFQFEPDALELRTEAYVDSLIFRSSRLDGFKPPGVDGKHRVAFDFVDPQSVIAPSIATPVLSNFSPPIKIGSDWPRRYF